jgi:hypothetical protein
MGNIFNRIYEKVSKIWLHYYTGQCEIERICSSGFHNSDMSFRFTKSLKDSKQLSTFSTIIFFPKPFAVKQTFDAIVDIKRIEVRSTKLKPQPKICSLNIDCCLVALRHINLVISSLEKSQKTVVKNDLRYRSLMAEFMSNMLGTDLVNHLDPPHEFDGGEVGFQGKVSMIVINVYRYTSIYHIHMM